MAMFTHSPKEVREDIIDCFSAGLVPFVTSSPGIGKSSIYAQIAKEFGLLLIDLRLSQCAPEDLMGLPMREVTIIGEDADGKPIEQVRATFTPFSTFPLEGDQIPKGYKGWLLLLDEFNSGTKMVQAAAYKIVLDRFVGQAKLHPQCFVGCAGNLATDRAIVNSLSTAMQSRLIHMEMALDHQGFMDFAVKAGFDSRILAFLEFRPGLLHSFKPDHTDRTFPCPRTWEFASRLLEDKTPEQAIAKQKLLAGTVGEGAAAELVTFLKVYQNLHSFTQIIKDPENISVPRDPGTLYATVMMMVEKFTRPTFEDVAKFVGRLPPDFQVIYCRGIRRKDPKFVRDPAYVALRKKLTRYLTADEDDIPAAA